MTAVSKRANTPTTVSRLGARPAKPASEARCSCARSGAAPRAQSSANALNPTKVSPARKGAQPADPVQVRRNGPVAKPSERMLE